MIQLYVFCTVILIVGMVFYVLHTKLHRVKRKIALSEHHFSRLVQLAERSLGSLDVPVGTILLYQGEIIGEGYNTVLHHVKAGEHAEINAISDALEKIGFEKFSSLDRSSLVLISTFEPCMMCAGAFINYNIQHVYFMKEKDILYTGKEEVRFVRYLVNRYQIKNRNEQDALFKRHPKYPLGK
ncbi:MAG: nucleoside deaminase [Bacteroidota bacterium]|nr:nucleoside deaminase [Bacteroidota bacterium]